MKLPRPPQFDDIADKEFRTDIILLDIIEYTLLPNERQYQCLYYLDKILRTVTGLLEVRSMVRGESVIRGSVPNGDGSYFILNPRIAGYGPLLALFLRNFLLFNNRFLDNLFDGVRTSVHHGAVIPISFMGTSNFVGEGLNVCARLIGRPVPAKARRFYDDDGNFVAVSEPAWEAFTTLFPPDKPEVQAYLEKIQFLHSRPVYIRDKHAHVPGYRLRFIDSAKLIGSAPPRAKEPALAS